MCTQLGSSCKSHRRVTREGAHLHFACCYARTDHQAGHAEVGQGAPIAIKPCQLIRQACIMNHRSDGPRFIASILIVEPKKRRAMFFTSRQNQSPRPDAPCQQPPRNVLGGCWFVLTTALALPPASLTAPKTKAVGGCDLVALHTAMRT
jgi:hypothetical protein